MLRNKNIALIPARFGSKRVPKKNIKLLNGIPLIAYTIDAAIKSASFSEIIVSTDSPEIAEISRSWGATVNTLRPSEFATDSSTDFEWIQHCLETMVKTPSLEINFLAILRPTSPLRKAATICNAIAKLQENLWADSLRAMEVTEKHPGKMWKLSKTGHAVPFQDQSNENPPTHNRPTQSLERLWIQNASLEIVRHRAFCLTGKISGNSVMGYEMPGLEGLDLNTDLDWLLLEALVKQNPELLQALR